eukprot:937291_1
MAEEVNVALSSPLMNSSTDHLHQSLRLLVRKIRAQLEVLTKKNKLKEEENDLLRNELSSLKDQLPNLQSIITTKTAMESTLNDQITELSTKCKKESQRHATIESELLKQLNALRQEKEDTITTHQTQTEQLIKDHEQILKTEKQNFDNLQHQKLSVDTKLQEIMQSNDLLHSKLKELQSKHQDMALTNTEKNELETRMEQLKTENIDYLSTIQQLKNRITDKDQEIHDIGMSLISMQNDLDCLQSQSQSKNQIVNEYQSKLKQSEMDLDRYQTQYKQLQETVHKLMDIATDMGNDSFWGAIESDTPQESTINEDNTENDDVLVMETVAHPFAGSPPSNIMIDATDTEHHKRLQWMKLLPKRVTDLQKQLREAHNQWIQEKETTAQVTTYWKTKLKELNIKNSDLCQRMEDLERMVDQLSSHNDRLIKENDALKAEMHNAKFTSSAHEIYLQMKTKEETEKTIELQQELDVLQDELLRKSAVIAKLEKSNMITKQSMMEQKKLHQTEMLQLTNKLNLLTQLSQEEIQQTFHLTIQELQSILDQHDVIPTDMDAQDMNHILDEKNGDNDMDSQHLLSPKIGVPHITDSDVGDNDDAEIIEAEDKLASYFARHKQRQLMMSKDQEKKQSTSVEPIEEANEEADGEEVVQPQIVEIVDDDVEDEDENILTPPLQEEIPYIVFDDTSLMAIDPAMANPDVSVSNVEVSNCSTRGNSTRGDQSPNSAKIDEPPTKADDDDDIDAQVVNLDDDDKKSDANEQELEDTAQIIVDTMDCNDDTKNEDDADNAQPFTAQTEEKADEEVRILHSLQTYLSGSTTNTLTSPQPFQQRARSLGSVATTVDDLQSVDQSMLAHDGSRDGSVVPSQSGVYMYGDEPDEELITAEIETNSNVPPLPNPSEYVKTPEVTGTDTIHSLELHDHSVDDIHHEAHQIIDQLHENLKDLQAAESKVPTIVQEQEAMDNQITNDDILGPLIERQQNHSHDSHDHEKNRKILNAAKAKWSKKVEEMIANTDAWFINEDGDIVLIYPEADNIEQNKETKHKSGDEVAGNDIENDNNQMQNDNDNASQERTIEIIEQELERKVEDINCENKILDNVENKMENEVIINENENEDVDKDQIEGNDVVESNLNDSVNANDVNTNNEDTTNHNVQKSENFFNSFRIF